MCIETIKGYSLESSRYVKDIDGTVYLFKHDQTHAKVMYIQNEDNHKTFGIGFRTPPPDSTGVPHIIEHSVLCGSRKYPLKDPFVELAKGSLNTYLNAMTYPDKTLYPISSQNDADFQNLMDVYLDAVFFPKIYDTPFILMQEGWRYHLEDLEAPLEYKGVVYNEMKGAFSSPEEVSFRKIKESLFPDTIYSNESGGAPEHIPELTYEDFLAFHQTYYHPSNAYICLYGKMNIEEVLTYIDKDYLSHFEYKAIDSEIASQKPFESILSQKYYYSVANEKEDQVYVSYNCVVGEAVDRELMVAMSILEYVLLDTPASPLKKALLKEQIGDDVFGVFQTHLKQPILTIMAKNVAPKKIDRFYEIIDEELKRIVREGLPKELLDGAIQIKEFELKEADFRGYSKGLLYFINSMKSWLYNEDPVIYLEHAKIMEAIKGKKEQGYFEGLIKTYLLENNHASKVQIFPKMHLDDENEKALENHLKELKESYDKQSLQQLIETTKAFNAFQNMPDSEEARHTIPILNKEDLERQVQFPKMEVREEKTQKYLITPTFTNDIVYLNYYFNIDHIENKYLPYIGMLVGLLSKLGTSNRSYEELSMYLDQHLGGLEYHIISVRQIQEEEGYKGYFYIKSKALFGELEAQLQIIHEIMTGTSFEDTKRLYEIIKELKSMMEMALSSEGHKVASGRLLGALSDADWFDEQTKGLSFYEFVCDLYDNWESKKETLLQELKWVYSNLILNKEMFVGITVDEEKVDEVTKLVETSLQQYPKADQSSLKCMPFKKEKIQEGLIYPGNVNYVAMGADYKDLGYSYHGGMLMLKSLLSMDYLWQNVRVKSGAYGCFADIRRSGILYFVSYRDPNVKETIETYRQVSTYVQNLSLSERELVQYLIGTISSMDFPYTASSEGATAQMYYLIGATKEMLQKTRDELFETNNETLRSFAPILEACFNKDQYCVFGNPSSIKKNKTLFKEVHEIH